MTKKEFITVLCICSIVFNIVFLYYLHRMCVREDVARDYINVLEECVGDELDDTAGSTDEYIRYYYKHN